MTNDEFGKEYVANINYTKGYLNSKGVHPKETIEDVAQIAWTRGWEYINTFRGDSKLITWINRIAMNEWISMARRTTSERNYPCYERPTSSFVTTSYQVPISRFLNKEHVFNFLHKYSAEHRKIFNLYYITGLQSKEVATVMGMAHNTVKVILFRMIATMRCRFQ